MPSVIEKMIDHGDFYPICLFIYSFSSQTVEKIRYIEGSNCQFECDGAETIDRDFNHAQGNKNRVSHVAKKREM